MATGAGGAGAGLAAAHVTPLRPQACNGGEPASLLWRDPGAGLLLAPEAARRVLDCAYALPAGSTARPGRDGVGAWCLAARDAEQGLGLIWWAPPTALARRDAGGLPVYMLALSWPAGRMVALLAVAVASVRSMLLVECPLQLRTWKQASRRCQYSSGWQELPGTANFFLCQATAGAFCHEVV